MNGRNYDPRIAVVAMGLAQIYFEYCVAAGDDLGNESHAASGDMKQGNQEIFETESERRSVEIELTHYLQTSSYSKEGPYSLHETIDAAAIDFVKYYNPESTPPFIQLMLVEQQSICMVRRG